MIYTLVEGNNSDLVKKVSDFYIKDGEVVADVTYGKGVFWRKVDLDRINLLKTDIITIDPPVDFRNLPYDEDSINHVVFDPPYMHTPGKPIVDERYKNSSTTSKMYHTDIMNDIYKKGMIEAYRVMKENGYLFVKCQDEIESGYQRWSHIEIYDIAKNIGFYGKDFFVLKPTSNPGIQYKKQQHARKNHSYLWVFQKLNKKVIDKLKARGIIL
jgi:hypothetical protein